MKVKFATNPPATGIVTIKSTAKSIEANFKRKQKALDKAKSSK